MVMQGYYSYYSSIMVLILNINIVTALPCYRSVMLLYYYNNFGFTTLIRCYYVTIVTIVLLGYCATIVVFYRVTLVHLVLL